MQARKERLPHPVFFLLQGCGIHWCRHQEEGILAKKSSALFSCIIILYSGSTPHQGFQWQIKFIYTYINRDSLLNCNYPAGDCCWVGGRSKLYSCLNWFSSCSVWHSPCSWFNCPLPNCPTRQKKAFSFSLHLNKWTTTWLPPNNSSMDDGGKSHFEKSSNPSLTHLLHLFHFLLLFPLLHGFDKLLETGQFSTNMELTVMLLKQGTT